MPAELHSLSLPSFGICYCFTGETPLLHAARQGHTETSKYLLEHGADPAIASDLGATALHHSAGIGAVSCLCFFFKAFATYICCQHHLCFLSG